ncbi:Acetyl-CoA acetyltransferase [Candidatus Paraburkholderia kirkii]|nr:Acetyl-CoA acetyltransferase [Candidatus Paraburkholderia kirkii]
MGRYGGVFRDIPAATLAETVIRELVRRTALDPAAIDDVIFGQCYPNGEAPAIGRVAGLDAGLGIRVPGLQIDRRCGSGLQAVIDAAMRIQNGAAELVLAGGAESMSQAEHYVLGARWGGLRAAASRQAAGIIRSKGGCSKPRRICAANTGSRATRRTSSRIDRTGARSRRTRPGASKTRSCRWK